MPLNDGIIIPNPTMTGKGKRVEIPRGAATVQAELSPLYRTGAPQASVSGHCRQTPMGRQRGQRRSQVRRPPCRFVTQGPRVSDLKTIRCRRTRRAPSRVMLRGFLYKPSNRPFPDGLFGLPKKRRISLTYCLTHYSFCVKRRRVFMSRGG